MVVVAGGIAELQGRDNGPGFRRERGDSLQHLPGGQWDVGQVRQQGFQGALVQAAEKHVAACRIQVARHGGGPPVSFKGCAPELPARS